MAWIHIKHLNKQGSLHRDQEDEFTTHPSKQSVNVECDDNNKDTEADQISFKWLRQRVKDISLKISFIKKKVLLLGFTFLFPSCVQGK